MILLLLLGVPVHALTGQEQADSAAAVRVTIVPASATAEVGKPVAFTVQLDGVSSRQADEAAAVTWFATPFDAALVDSTGVATFYTAGSFRVGAAVGGTVGWADVTVTPAPVARLDLEPPTAVLAVGGTLEVTATPLTPSGALRSDVPVSWQSEAPATASVSEGGLVTGVAAGRTRISASAGEATASIDLEVVPNPVRSLAITPASSRARTGDVVRFKAVARDSGGTVVEQPSIRWTVSGSGAQIESDGGFVAEGPGSYIVTATSGGVAAVGLVRVRPRGVDRTIEVVGRAPFVEHQIGEQWITGRHAYLSSIADRMWVYDLSDPSHPVKTDSILVDARLVNDVSTSVDGRVGVLTREGASSRKDGVVFFDASDPSHPEILSEYTETVTGGVHSAYIDGHYAYLTDNATGSLRVLDILNPRTPREVARWQVESAYSGVNRPSRATDPGARYLHDLHVRDGLAYLAYWKDGLVILDVGNGIRGGSPEDPRLVSQVRFDHAALYGPGWIAGTHATFRYEDYLFVGDEVLPGFFDIESRERLVTRGILHVLDVSDIEHPRKVAEYEVPEAGVHNFWVADDILYLGCTYGGGARVVDVSGELRGDLYAQGREIARLWTGDSKGFRPNQPAVWGAQPHDGLIYFNDINSGLWIARLGEPRDRGSTTAPGQ